MTCVVNIRKSKYDILITRESQWGNPYRIGKDGTREEVIKKYKSWILTQPILLARSQELKGKVLGCVCKPLECHGDILVEVINHFHPDGFDLKDKPHHLIINNKRSWIDLDKTNELNKINLFSSSLVWLQECNNSYSYIITTVKSILCEFPSENIDEHFSMFIAQQSTLNKPDA